MSSLSFILQLQKTTTSRNFGLLSSLVVCSSIVEDNDKSGSRFVIVLGCFALIAEYDNEPLDLLFFTFFSSIVENNDKPGSSSSSLSFFL